MFAKKGNMQFDSAKKD